MMEAQLELGIVRSLRSKINQLIDSLLHIFTRAVKFSHKIEHIIVLIEIRSGFKRELIGVCSMG